MSNIQDVSGQDNVDSLQEVPSDEAFNQVAGTPKIIASGAPSQNWRMRVSSLSPEISKLLCYDDRLQELEPDALGTLIRIHCLTRLGRNVPCDLKLAARLLSTSTRKLKPAIEALLDAMPDLLLNDGEFFFVPTLLTSYSGQADALSAKRREAALNRWKDDSVKSKNKKTDPQSLLEPGASYALAGEGGNIDLSPKSPEDFQKALFGDDLMVSAPEGTLVNKRPPCPYQELADIFNSVCTSLSQVNAAKTWSASRRSAMGNRWRERADIEFWRNEVFGRTQRSDFLTGRAASTPWQANFDWIIKPVNLQKIIEGNYDNRGAARRALWDQGEKSRDRSTASSMVSEIHADSPFMTQHVAPLNPLTDSCDGAQNPLTSGSSPTLKPTSMRPSASHTLFMQRRPIEVPVAPSIAQGSLTSSPLDEVSKSISQDDIPASPVSDMKVDVPYSRQLRFRSTEPRSR